MKFHFTLLALTCALLGAASSQAAVRYVDVNSASPAPPYTSWATAAVTIQDAIDVASAGDQILVTNGVYQTGGRVVAPFTLTNRVVVDKAVTLQSVNGPEVTIIRGNHHPEGIRGSGPNSVRCVYLTNGAALVGFTMTNGGTWGGHIVGQSSGGGVLCESTNAVVSDCIITGNFAILSGGGVCSGTLNNCTIRGNTSAAGGGASGARLDNCLLTENMGIEGGGAAGCWINNCTLTTNGPNLGSHLCYGGGAYGSTLENCLVEGNSGFRGGGAYFSDLSNCTVTGNSANDNERDGGGGYACHFNNCIVYYNSGANYPNYYPTNSPTIYFNSSCTTPMPLVGLGNFTNAPLFVDQAGGNFRLETNSPCINTGNNSYVIGNVDLDGNPRISKGIVDVGAYEFQFPIHYVNLNNATPATPFTTWSTAATNLQDAIDAADHGDIIVVSNGVYQTGGRVVAPYALTNRVVVDKAVMVHSLNGPLTTIIEGHQAGGLRHSGDSAVRCVYLTNGAALIGFTLTHGATLDSVDRDHEGSGGGAWCESSEGVLSNCVIVANSSHTFGGGVYSGTVNNCTLTNNESAHGGGAYLSILNNCLLTGNPGIFGGGANLSTLNNCTLTGNHGAAEAGGASHSELNNCLLTGNSSFRYGGALSSTLNNCTVTGNSASDKGCGVAGCRLKNTIIYYNSSPDGSNFYGAQSFTNCCTTPLPISAPGTNYVVVDCFTNEPRFVDQLVGNFRLQSNSPCINAGNNLFAPGPVDLDGNPRIRGGIVDVGAYEVPFVVHYVNVANPAPAWPFDSWETAATNIQDAINVADNGNLVLVTNGVYRTGGYGIWTPVTNRVVLEKPITVQSVNGPLFTLIEGNQVSGAPYGAGPGAVRCAYLTNGSALIGFTLTNGGTGTAGGQYHGGGGGAFCFSTEAVLSNCVVVGNAANETGGGVYGGTLNDCILTGNLSRFGGGAYAGILNNCILTNNSAVEEGGGVRWSTLYNCTISGNHAAPGAPLQGGGTAFSTLYNCTISGNSAARFGGAVGATLINCTVIGNSATEYGGGVSGGQNKNCIIYHNSAPAFPNYHGSSPAFTNCCTTPLPVGEYNFTNEPALVDQSGGNFRLQSDSPCINSGNNSYAPGPVDLDGNPRIAGGTVDMGAYEFQTPASALSYAWAQQYGLPTDGSADSSDSDGDLHNNWQEWRASTNPTNVLSVLNMLTPANGGPGVTVSWQSVNGVKYFLQRSLDLGAPPAFLTLKSNLVGQAGTTSYTDTNAVGFGPFFYRVGVQ